MAAGQAGWQPGVAGGRGEAEMVQTMNRRDRVRAATTQEIKQTARRLLVQQGTEAVSLRAIAREMGMTAPALYRYFDSHDELITACREFRRWAMAQHAEFGLIFGTPLAGVDIEHDDFTAECGRRFGGTFLALYLELWQAAPFPVPDAGHIDPLLRLQLEHYREVLGQDLPLAAELPVGAMLTFLRCWVRLYGAVSLEVFGHMRFALDDAAPMFEITLSELASLVGLENPAVPAS